MTLTFLGCLNDIFCSHFDLIPFWILFEPNLLDIMAVVSVYAFIPVSP